MQTLLQCLYTPARSHTDLHPCTWKDPVVHVRVQWIMETLKHPACTLDHNSVAAGFPQGRQPKFPTGETRLGRYSCQKKKFKKSRKVLCGCLYTGTFYTGLSVAIAACTPLLFTLVFRVWYIFCLFVHFLFMQEAFSVVGEHALV